MLLAIDLRSVKFLCTSQEANVSTIKEGAKKFPTVQTRKKFKVEILQKVPVCTTQVPFCSPVTDVCTAPRIVEEQSALGFDRWLTWQVSIASVIESNHIQFPQHPAWQGSERREVLTQHLVSLKLPCIEINFCHY